MVALRLLVILAAVAVAVLVVGYLLNGDRRFLRWAGRTLIIAALVALGFFAILIVERLA